MLPRRRRYEDPEEDSGGSGSTGSSSDAEASTEEQSIINRAKRKQSALELKQRNQRDRLRRKLERAGLPLIIEEEETKVTIGDLPGDILEIMLIRAYISGMLDEADIGAVFLALPLEKYGNVRSRFWRRVLTRKEAQESIHFNPVEAKAALLDHPKYDKEYAKSLLADNLEYSRLAARSYAIISELDGLYRNKSATYRKVRQAELFSELTPVAEELAEREAFAIATENKWYDQHVAALALDDGIVANDMWMVMAKRQCMNGSWEFGWSQHPGISLQIVLDEGNYTYFLVAKHFDMFVPVGGRPGKAQTYIDWFDNTEFRMPKLLNPPFKVYPPNYVIKPPKASIVRNSITVHVMQVAFEGSVRLEDSPMQSEMERFAVYYHLVATGWMPKYNRDAPEYATEPRPRAYLPQKRGDDAKDPEGPLSTPKPGYKRTVYFRCALPSCSAEATYSVGDNLHYCSTHCLLQHTHQQQIHNAGTD